MWKFNDSNLFSQIFGLDKLRVLTFKHSRCYMKFFRFLFSGIMTLFLVFILDNRFADIPYLQNIPSIKNTPALGKLLNPFGGFWKNAESRSMPKITRLDVDSLDKQVDIIFDDRLVPHIFAKTEKDLYFAQGYITARFRLWQMDFLSYVAGGKSFRDCRSRCP